MEAVGVCPECRKMSTLREWEIALNRLISKKEGYCRCPKCSREMDGDMVQYISEAERAAEVSRKYISQFAYRKPDIGLYRVWNGMTKRWQFQEVVAQSPNAAYNQLKKTIGNDARKWRFEFQLWRSLDADGAWTGGGSHMGAPGDEITNRRCKQHLEQVAKIAEGRYAEWREQREYESMC